jgi:hypothetical protein
MACIKQGVFFVRSSESSLEDLGSWLLRTRKSTGADKELVFQVNISMHRYLRLNKDDESSSE